MRTFIVMLALVASMFAGVSGVVNADFVRVFPKGFAGPTAITLIGK